MTKIMSQEEFVKKVFDFNPTIEILSEYKGCRKPVLKRCKICGDERFTLPKSIFGNGRCVVCSAKERALKRRKTHDIFVNEIKSINKNIILMSEYITSDTPIKCKCKIDDFEWTTTPRILSGGSGCPQCARKKNEIASRYRRTHEEFLQEMSNRFENIKVLSEFKSTSKKVNFLCTDCGYKWSSIPNSILRSNGCGCPKCAGKAPVSESEFIDRLSRKNKKVSYVGGYTKMLDKAMFSCNKCGHKWSAMASNVLSGKGCPRCKISHGAKEIEKYLNDHFVSYVTEYRFEDCKDERFLPFDFYLPLQNIVIEYDGEQHFKPVQFGAYEESISEEKFHKTQLHDNIKNNYCENNNIKIIRIPYTEYNQIEEILDKHFS